MVLSDLSVSSRHAIIELKDQAYWITDRGSTNGTLLNQQRLVPQVPSQLHPGATIRLGNITCTYEVVARPSRSSVSIPSSKHENTSARAYTRSSPTIERQQQDRVGQRFGNYRLSRLLGLGGFAEVYLGEHIFLDTQTAIKVLYTQLVGQDVEQFRQEARTIARMEHPHIVRLLDFGVEGATPYLIMSYAPNGTMRQRYPKGTRLPLVQVVSYVKQISEALQYAHDHKVIHRDIKPENVLFGPDDQVVLSDFGIALVTQSSRFQQPNDMAGTIAYMAPEQFESHPRPASDQYSLGIIVYEWLCGERPFNGSFTEIAVKHQLVAPPSLQEKVPSLSADVDQVVLTALAKDPKARFGNIRAFATALEQASRSSPDLAVQPSQMPSSNEATSILNKEPQLPEVATRPSALTQPPKTADSQSQPSMPPSTSPGEAPPVKQTSLPTAQVTPPASQPHTPLPAHSSPSVTGQSTTKIQPRQQRISRISSILMIVAIVIVVGGGLGLFGLLHSSGSGSGSTNAGSIPGGSLASTLIKIGTDLPTSGKDLNIGKPTQDGAQLAMDQANQNHTIPNVTLAFDPKDDTGPSGLHDPTVGAANVTALISDAKVAGIVGPFNSNVAKAEMPIANQAPIALISPANTNPCLTQEASSVGCSGANDLVPTLRPTGKVTYFRVATTDDHQGTAGADYMYKVLGLHSVYVIDDAETYGIGIAKAFVGEWQNLGGTLIGHSSEPGTTTSYVSLLTQIASLHPDGIYFGGLDSSGGILIRQQMLQVPGLQNLIYAGGDGIVTPAFASTIQPLGGGHVYGTFAAVDTSTNPSAASFRQQYAAAFPSDPTNVYSAAAYDSANILIQAIKTALANGAKAPASSGDTASASTFRQAVITAVQGISFVGLTGHQSFDQNGDTTNKVLTIYKLGLNDANMPDWIFASTVAVQ